MKGTLSYHVLHIYEARRFIAYASNIVRCQPTHPGQTAISSASPMLFCCVCLTVPTKKI